MDSSDVQQEIDSQPPVVKETIRDESTENDNKAKEKKPFNLIEELKKPYVVGIKPEYVVQKDGTKRDSQDNKEPIQGVTYKTKRTRSDVGAKRRDEYKSLCKSVALGEECSYGDTCKFDHDVKTFFANRKPDISPSCPVWERHGYCPSGFTCRWAGSHVTPDLKLVAKPKEEQIPIIEYNEIAPLLQSMRKKTYVFHCNSQNETPVGALAESEIHPIDFTNKIYIAPLTTVGNLPFRRICLEFGADITCSEMALTGNLLRGQVSEWALLRRHPSEKCFGIQLASGRVEEVEKVTEFLRREFRCDFVDLNCGCPIEILDKMGAGGALMGHPNKLRRLVAGALNAAETLPVVCKLRTGEKENTLERFIGSIAEVRGKRGNRLNAMTIHGRTKVGRYTKLADWEYVERCASVVNKGENAVQVIGNGDVFDHEMYYQHLESGALNGVMIGRGALIKPWICTEIKERRHWDISAGERLDMIKQFCWHGLEHWGSDEQGVDRTRRFLLEWLSFLCRYVPYGLLERPQRINQRPFAYVGRSDLETLLGSPKASDWIKISEMFLGPVPDGYTFIPKHKSNAYIESFV